MVKTITTYSASSVLALLLFFGLAFQAFAYDDLEIEIEFDDGKAMVEVDYDEDGSDVELEFEYETEELDEVYAKLAEELDITEETVEDAVSEIEYSDEDEDNEDEDEDEDEKDEEDDDDDYDVDKKRPAACDKNVRGNAYGLRAQCEDKNPAEYMKERKEKRAAKCEAAELDDDADRERWFCRGGEWKEKREARLDDIMDGFIEAGDLDDDEAEAIRTEVRQLIRQLLMLIMANR